MARLWFHATVSTARCAPLRSVASNATEGDGDRYDPLAGQAPRSARFGLGTPGLQRKSVRQRQAREIIQRLAGRTASPGADGRFQLRRRHEGSDVGHAGRRVRSSVRRAEATDMVSFPSRNKRFDWIMISDESIFSNPERSPTCFRTIWRRDCHVGPGERLAAPK